MELTQIRFGDDLAVCVKNAAKRTTPPVGAHIRDTLAQAARPGEGAFGYHGPKNPHALQAYLAHDFAYASGWDNLQAVLRVKGYELAERRGGLILQTTEGEHLCKASDIGQPHSTFINRFGTLLSRHAHAHLVQRHLDQSPSMF